MAKTSATATATAGAAGADTTTTRSRKYWILMAANYAALFIGSIASSLLSRFYFIHGGSSRWLSTWVQSTGFPLLLIPIYLSPSGGGGAANTKPFSTFTPLLFSLCIVIGLFLGLNNFLFSWGISYLSVSTSSLLLSSQLAFNLLLSVVLVRQKLRLSNVNCVVLLTLSSILLGLGSSKDMPAGVTKPQFFLGFFATLGAAALFALYLPVMEMVLKRIHTYRMVMEMQLIMEAAATAFAVVGMAASGGVKEVSNDSTTRFDLGMGAYWITVAATVVCWQMCFMATAGSVFLTSSLNSGICMTALLSLNVLCGVVVFGDVFGGMKAVSTALCIWAFSTYLFAEYRRSKKQRSDAAEVLVGEGKEMVRVRVGEVGEGGGVL